MIDLKKLQELVALMVDNDLIELDIRDGEESVSLSRPSANAQPVYQAPPPAPTHAAPAPAAPAASAPAADSSPADNGNLVAIESPMVGTFYTSSKPEAPAFVKVGDRVDPDTVVCLIEAMKVFSEVKAEVSGVVKQIVTKNSDSVEFGQTLMLVDPD